ncbi:MAG: hypothetical protein LQ338_000454 [Usnochroma carphineum]|nr:MAG: hypothetical protein LQ338_000454 [Usnochroma carphineum]
MKKSIIKRRKRVVPAMQEHVHSNQQPPSFGAGDPSEPQYFENEDVQNQLSPQGVRDMNTDGHNQEQFVEHQPEYETPPIDFTGYQINQSRHPSTQSQQQRPSPSHAHEQPYTEPQNRLSPFQSSHARKRSYSNTEQDNAPTSPPPSESGRANRLSSISSILNPTQQRREEMPIDPSLSLLGQQALRQSQTTQQSHQQLPPPQTSNDQQKPRRPSNVDPGEWILQRKAKLRQEAEQMREALRAKEREIEELDGEG